MIRKKKACLTDELACLLDEYACSCRERKKGRCVLMLRPWSGPLADSPSSLFLGGACLLLTATDQIWLTKINGRALTSDQFNLATVLARNKRAHCQHGSAHFSAYSIPLFPNASIIKLGMCIEIGSLWLKKENKHLHYCHWIPDQTFDVPLWVITCLLTQGQKSDKGRSAVESSTVRITAVTQNNDSTRAKFDRPLSVGTL